MKLFAKNKKVGIVAIDRSGSDSNKPYVVASVFAKNKKDFPEAYREIKKLCSQYNPVLGYAKEVKAKEIKSAELKRKIIKVVLGFGLKIHVTVFRGNVKGLATGRERGYVKTEADLWLANLKSLIKKERLRPEQIMMDISFSNTKDQSLFDFLIQSALEKEFGIRPFVKSLDSRFEDSIKIADLVAGCFRENEMRAVFKKAVHAISESDVKITTKGPPHLTGILWSNDSEISDNINFSPFPRFKPFAEELG